MLRWWGWHSVRCSWEGEKRRLLPLMISKAEKTISQSAMGSRTLTQGKSGNDLPIDKEREWGCSRRGGVYWNDERQERRPQDLSVTRVKNHKKKEKPQKKGNKRYEGRKKETTKREERQERENWKTKKNNNRRPVVSHGLVRMTTVEKKEEHHVYVN